MRSCLLWVPLGQRHGAQGIAGPCPCPPPLAWVILGSPGGHQEEGGWHRDTTGPPAPPSGTPLWTAWPGPGVSRCSHTGHGGRAFPRAKFASSLQSLWGLARSKARAGVTSRSLAAARGGGLWWIITRRAGSGERESRVSVPGERGSCPRHAMQSLGLCSAVCPFYRGGTEAGSGWVGAAWGADSRALSPLLYPRSGPELPLRLVQRQEWSLGPSQPLLRHPCWVPTQGGGLWLSCLHRTHAQSSAPPGVGVQLCWGREGFRADARPATATGRAGKAEWANLISQQTSEGPIADRAATFHLSA